MKHLKALTLCAVLLACNVGLPEDRPKQPERSPHSEALMLVFTTQQAAIRKVDQGNWWHDTKKREWSVKRPFASGWMDSTHLFNVSYRIDGKEIASWFVDTRSGKVERQGSDQQAPK